MVAVAAIHRAAEKKSSRKLGVFKRVLPPKQTQSSGSLAFNPRGAGGPLGPLTLNLLLLSYPPFVSSRRVHEGDGRVRNLGVTVAIVADEDCPGLAAQQF